VVAELGDVSTLIVVVLNASKQKKVDGSQVVLKERGQMTDRELALLRLQLTPLVGPKTLRALLSAFGSADAVWKAGAAEWAEVPGVGRKVVENLRAARSDRRAEDEAAWCAANGVGVICEGGADYPESLSRIVDPPAVLFCRGALIPADQLAIAVIGSRQCTLYGRQQAEKLAQGLASAGITVVSGLARGIDSAAHRGALAGNGRTVAILGTGLANIYPPEHADLAAEIGRTGSVVSEMPHDQVPLPGLFPQRNRIIAGMSLGVLVVEANRNSGAMHTVRHAIEQGREVYAVPGRIDSLASEGCHDLIRDGATLVRSVDDILQALGPLSKPVAGGSNGVSGTNGTAAAGGPGGDILSARELTLNEIERAVLDRVGTEARSIDSVLASCDLEPSRVLATLTILEMKRFVQRLAGGQIARL
jgi:DNA processing protein